MLWILALFLNYIKCQSFLVCMLNYHWLWCLFMRWAFNTIPENREKFICNGLHKSTSAEMKASIRHNQIYLTKRKLYFLYQNYIWNFVKLFSNMQQIWSRHHRERSKTCESPMTDSCLLSKKLVFNSSIIWSQTPSIQNFKLVVMMRYKEIFGSA